MRTFGVEEELLLVDGLSGQTLPLGHVVKHLGTSEHLCTEFQLEQIEMVSSVHLNLRDLADDIRTGRAYADKTARAAGARAAALATSPLPAFPHITPDERYEAMADLFGLVGREHLVCGLHVHVSIESDEEGVAVLDRIRPWLAILTALSANSPFWNGHDAGHASFRSQVLQRLPVTGPTDVFGSAEAYHALLRQMLEADVSKDLGMIYFDARLSRHHPTVEIRVADVCLWADDTVLIAALARALVETATQQWRAGEPPHPVPTSVLRLAAWRAGKWGMGGHLLHPVERRLCPAEEVAAALVAHVEPALAETGDLTVVQQLLGQLLHRGTGARRQLAALRRTGRLADVVLEAVELTHGA